MDELTFRLPGIVRSREQAQDFEGPLNLILMLLAKDKIEIRDIQISQILDQYLDYLQRMERMDLEVASEFVQMASHLVYIKTKTLLAGEQEVSELELLISSLEQLRCRDAFEAVKQVIPGLSKALEAGQLLYSTPPEPLGRYGQYEYRHAPWELLNALAALQRRGAAVREPPLVPVPRPVQYSARKKGRQLLEILHRDGPTPLSVFYAMAGSRSELVATFVSLLEMCAMGSVCLERDGEDYTVRFTGGDMEQILENLSQ